MPTINWFLRSILILSLCNLTASAQSSFSSTSHSATIQGNTYEYVIGEMTVVSTDRNTNLIVTQGFLQPDQSNKPSDVANVNAADFIKAYPNPTNNILNIELKDDFTGKVTYQLFDAAGKVIMSGNNDGKNKFTLNLEALAIANYYLLLSVPNAAGTLENYSFKIQKK